MSEVCISRDVLEELYWTKGLSSGEIADKFGINQRTVLKKLKKCGIKRKTVSEALTKKFKKPFSGDQIEKAFFLGLRAGDFYAKWARRSVRIQTTTTHLAQVELLEKSFAKYGELRKYLSKHKSRDDEWFIYIDLDPSFDFLLVKPEEIPEWIMKECSHFYSFLTAYCDCELNWNLTKSHGKNLRATFRLRTGDKVILGQMKEFLKTNGFSPLLTLEIKQGKTSPFGVFNIDIYNLTMNRKKDVIRIIKNLLPLSKHSEKIRKMEFILNNYDRTWSEFGKDWKELRKKIKEEVLK